MAKKSNKGLFITLEGGEGAGKTTLLYQLQEYFKKRGREVLITREPGGSVLGETIRQWLLQQNAELPIGHHAELLLFLAARAQHIEEKIMPALAAGMVVLCDRFNDSTIAYQGGARGLGIAHVEKLCQMVCGVMIPQLTLYLKVSPEIGLARSCRVHKEQSASGELDRIESEALAFHQKIQATFEYLAHKEPLRIHTIDANQSQELVCKEAFSVIRKFTGPSENPKLDLK